MNRRTFLRCLGATGAALALPALAPRPTAAGPATPADWIVGPDDIEIVEARLRLGRAAGWAAQPFGAVVAAYGGLFLGTPYLAFSLDDTGAERLILNLQGLDCLTFVETALALARTLHLGGRGVHQYARQIERLRYRGGRRAGYPSRLHYFEDWLDDNAARRNVQLLTAALGGEVLAKQAGYMSTHREAYPVLARDDAALAAIQAQEARINDRTHHYIPKAHAPAVAAQIESGDVLGLTSSRDGLLIGHTGLAYRTDDGVLRLLHEPSPGYSVTITAESLADYLSGSPQLTGMMVARPVWAR